MKAFIFEKKDFKNASFGFQISRAPLSWIIITHICVFLNLSTYHISAPPRSAQHEEKPLGLFWQFRPSTSNYNDTLYYNLEEKV